MNRSVLASFLLSLLLSLQLASQASAQGVNAIANSTPATSTSSGAFTVVGGVGIGGALYVGGGIFSGGAQALTLSGTPTPGNCVEWGSPNSQLVDAGAPCGSGGGGGGISNVLGTGGQITSNVSGGIATLSLPATITSNETFSGGIGFTGSIGGVAITNYLASPPIIGGTSPNAGNFTNLNASGTITMAGLSTGTQINCVGLNSSHQLVLSSGGCGSGGGSGTVTSAGFSVPATSIFSVTGTNPITSSGTFGFSTTGNSGGIPYFSSTSQLTSSAALTLNAPVLGGGAGGAPTVGTRSGNTTEIGTVSGSVTSTHGAAWDSNGNLVDSGGVYGMCPALPANTTTTNSTITTNSAGCIISIASGSGSDQHVLGTGSGICLGTGSSSTACLGTGA